MITKLQLDPGAIAPHRAHATDVGYDIHALYVDVAYIRRGSQNHIWKVLIDTGVHLTPPKGYYFELVPNSRLAQSPFIYANSIGVIDPDYTGSIKVVLNAEYDLLRENALPKPGDVVGQLILRKQLSTSFAPVSALAPTERGNGGFGSTATR